MNSTAFKKKVTSNVKDPNTECEDNETQMNRQKPSGEHTRAHARLQTHTHTRVHTNRGFTAGHAFHCSSQGPFPVNLRQAKQEKQNMSKPLSSGYVNKNVMVGESMPLCLCECSMA